MQSNTQWKRFEQIVAFCEEVLSPKGAIIKSPDLIPDKDTGQLREVDVSIRYKIGSADILIIVECRDRHKIQDVTWIEQLIAKKNSIGASKIIIVTSKGLSKPAIKKAIYNDIVIRKLENITKETINKFTELKFYHYEHMFPYGFVANGKLNNTLDNSLPITELKVYDVNRSEIFVDDIIYCFWDLAIKNKILPPKPLNKTPNYKYNIAFPLPKQTFFFKKNDKYFEWKNLIISFTLTENVISIESQAFIYTGNDDQIVVPFLVNLPNELDSSNLYHTSFNVDFPSEAIEKLKKRLRLDWIKINAKEIILY